MVQHWCYCVHDVKMVHVQMYVELIRGIVVTCMCDAAGSGFEIIPK